MKKIIMLLIILVLISPTVSAELEGNLSIEYDSMNTNSYGNFLIQNNFNNKFKIGGEIESLLDNNNSEKNNYKLFMKFDLTDDISLKFEKGTNRYFREPNYPRKYDKDYFKIGAKYYLLKNINSISSYVSMEYDPESNKSFGTIYLMKNITDNLRLGGKMVTDMTEWKMKNGWFPAGYPERQTYDFIIEYDLSDNITLNLTEGCRHYFSQSNKDSDLDDWYLKYGITYNF